MSELALFSDPSQPGAGLHRQLDELHQMIYRRGGIRPVNAAIEELAKLVLMEFCLAERADHQVPGHGPLTKILDPIRLAGADDVVAVKEAFRHVAALPDYAGRLPGGGTQPIWPADEPLRLSRADIIAAAIELLRPQIALAHSSRFDVIGTAFDIFLRGRYDHSGGLGTHLTPHTVATMLARVCATGLTALGAPATQPVIGDPCCGTGRFLIAAVNEIAPDADDPRRSALLEHGLLGVDQSSSSVAKARLNLLLLGGRQPNVFTVEDSLVDRHIDTLRRQLRLILTNPPFGDGKYDHELGIRRTAEALPALSGRRRVDPALAFVTRCLDLLADGGRLGIVLPDGLLDGPILRRALLGNDVVRLREVSVEANISLPSATFALAGTVARTSALVLRRQSKRRSCVFIARADHVGYLKQGSGSVVDPAGDDLPDITVAAQRFLGAPVEDASGVRFVSRRPLAATVPLRDVMTLDPARVDPAAVAARERLRAADVRFRALLNPSQRRQRRAADVPFVSVLHVDDLGAVAWHEAQRHRPVTPGLEAQPGDILFSLLNPRKLRATVVPVDVGPILCSSEFGIFEATGDPYAVLVLLHHPLVRAQLSPLGRGTSSSRRRISPDDLLDVFAPQLAPDRLAELAYDVRSALEALRTASIAADAAYAGVST